MDDIPQDIKDRTFDFAARVVRLCKKLEQDSRTSGTLSHQLLRSGTSIGANYREANRARSRADFKNRIKICESEASETQYWLKVIVMANWLSREQVMSVYDECSQLLAIFTSSGKNI